MKDIDEIIADIGLIVIAIISIVVIIVGITRFSDGIEGEKQISEKLECVDGNYTCSEWIDTETGVHYFFTQRGGLILRVNADGSPYVEGE